jgi:hypothetical protein
MAEIQIDVDDLPVMVDAEEYGTDPEYVIRQVRQGRQDTRLHEGELEADDYNRAVGADE